MSDETDFQDWIKGMPVMPNDVIAIARSAFYAGKRAAQSWHQSLTELGIALIVCALLAYFLSLVL